MAPPASPPQTPATAVVWGQAEWTVVGVTYAAYYAQMTARCAVDVTMPALKAAGALDDAGIGRLLGVGFAAYAVGKTVSGVLVDAAGARNMLLLLLLWCVAAMLAFPAVLGPAAPSRPALALLMGLWFGLRALQASAYPAVGKVYAAWFATNGLARALGLVSTSSRAASTGAGLFLGPLIAVFGWPASLVASALLAALAAALVWTRLQAAPGAGRGSAAGSAAGTEVDDGTAVAGKNATDAKEPGAELTWRQLLAMLLRTPQVYVAVASVVTITPLSELQSLLPLYLREHGGFSPSAAAMAAAAYPAGSALALVSLGYVYDGWTPPRRRLAILGSLALALGSLLMLNRLDMQAPGSRAAAVVLVFLYGFGFAGPYYFPVPMYCVRLAGSSWSGTLLAAMDTPGFVFSFFFYSQVPVWLAEGGGGAGHGWAVVMGMIARLLVASMVLMLVFFAMDQGGGGGGRSS